MREKKSAEIKAKIAAMTDEEMDNHMADIITKDVMAFVETVVRQRVKLFVREIHKGIAGLK